MLDMALSKDVAEALNGIIQDTCGRLIVRRERDYDHS